MHMKFWKRRESEQDPLLNKLLKDYHLNLLSPPRENAFVGDLYFRDTHNNEEQIISTPGSITNFLEPKFEIDKKIIAGEKLSDISEAFSKELSADVALSFLEDFLSVLLSNSFIGKIRSSYGSKDVKLVKFRFSNVTRDYIDPFLLGRELNGYRVIEDHPLYSENYRYYIVTAVVRSTSISIMSQGDNNKEVGIQVDPIQKLIDVSTEVAIKKLKNEEVTFEGRKRLAFGIELYELIYDNVSKRFRMKPAIVLDKVRKDDDLEIDTEFNPALIGDSREGYAFITIK